MVRGASGLKYCSFRSLVRRLCSRSPGVDGTHDARAIVRVTLPPDALCTHCRHGKPSAQRFERARAAILRADRVCVGADRFGFGCLVGHSIPFGQGPWLATLDSMFKVLA